jgi:hypothetical protein
MQAQVCLLVNFHWLLTIVSISLSEMSYGGLCSIFFVTQATMLEATMGDISLAMHLCVPVGICSFIKHSFRARHCASFPNTEDWQYGSFWSNYLIVLIALELQFQVLRLHISSRTTGSLENWKARAQWLSTRDPESLDSGFLSSQPTPSAHGRHYLSIVWQWFTHGAVEQPREYFVTQCLLTWFF